jgi:hypothetical protein
MNVSLYVTEKRVSRHASISCLAGAEVAERSSCIIRRPSSSLGGGLVITRVGVDSIASLVYNRFWSLTCLTYT